MSTDAISRPGGLILCLCLCASCATEPFDRPRLEQARRRATFAEGPIDFTVEVSSAAVSVVAERDELVR
ncbi:MAG: hypothetical protein ACO3UM_18500, partial [Planctomycetota bacterium]